MLSCPDCGLLLSAGGHAHTCPIDNLRLEEYFARAVARREMTPEQLRTRLRQLAEEWDIYK